MAAEENRLARFKAKVEELSPKKRDGSRKLSVGYHAVADELEVTYDYVYQLYTGKSGKKWVGPDVVAAFERVYGEGRSPGWMDKPLPAADQAASDADFEPLDASVAPALGDAIATLADVLSRMEPLGREFAATALASLAKSPDQASKLTQTLVQLAATYTQPPPEPSSAKKAEPPKRAANTMAERRHTGKPSLVLKLGGGQKQQFDLPLRREAFTTDAAPPKEREWYERVKAAPKAREGQPTVKRRSRSSTKEPE